MTSRLRQEGVGFVDAAPRRYAFEAEVAAPRERVFAAVTADPSTWNWFPGLTAGGYEDPGAHGVGSRRWVRAMGIRYRETILARDEPTRWVYRVDECSVPLVSALVEEWRFEDHNSATSVRWTFAVDPRSMYRLLVPAPRSIMGPMFRRAMRNLQAELSS